MWWTKDLDKLWQIQDTVASKWNCLDIISGNRENRMDQSLGGAFRWVVTHKNLAWLINQFPTWFISMFSPFMNGYSPFFPPIPSRPEDLHEVDGHTLSSESTTAADAVDVQLAVVGQVIANHQGHLPAGSRWQMALRSQKLERTSDWWVTGVNKGWTYSHCEVCSW